MKLSIYGPRLVLALSLLSIPSWPQQNGSLTESSVPVYQVKFNAGEPVSGIGGIHVISLPFGCTELGTVFITMVQPTGGVGSGNQGPNTLSLLLVSVSLSGEAHSFPLNQVPNLHDVENLGQSESDSNVLFLVRATAKDSSGQSLTGDHRPIRKPAERHDYILVFDRQGSYQREMAVDAPMRAIEIGRLPSGGILLYGYDEATRDVKVALLKDDGTFLRFLELPNNIPAKTLHGLSKDSKTSEIGFGSIQFLLQQNAAYLSLGRYFLKISDGGLVEILEPKLPDTTNVVAVIPSDNGLYLLVRDGSKSSVFEVSLQNGSLLRQFVFADGSYADSVACVHDRQFVSFDLAGDRVLRLVGTAEPVGR